MAPTSAPPLRILDTANRLFYEEGLRVGIDRVIAESHVAKASFYRHYPSKDDLVAAYLRRRHEEWMRWFVRRVDALANERGPRLERIADVLREWFGSDGFHGSAFINALADASLAPVARDVVRRHDDELRETLLAFVEHVGLEPAEELVEDVLVVVDGAVVRAQHAADRDAAMAAADTAGRLLARLAR
ncbi:TetR/AcrR family transcriptional regulator [Agromyces sp. MMS24-K17]|uniref:TetR/AcrR family transcriptional regulator n=1 Tax=Agromyces sp. MMS24-K17 TaxID=3372850 RepID=UPI0037544B20